GTNISADAGQSKPAVVSLDLHLSTNIADGDRAIVGVHCQVAVPRREYLEADGPASIVVPVEPTDSFRSGCPNPCPADFQPNLRSQVTRIRVAVGPGFQAGAHQDAVLRPSFHGDSAVVPGLDIQPAGWSECCFANVAGAGAPGIAAGIVAGQ